MANGKWLIWKLSPIAFSAFAISHSPFCIPKITGDGPRRESRARLRMDSTDFAGGGVTSRLNHVTRVRRRSIRGIRASTGLSLFQSAERRADAGNILDRTAASARLGFGQRDAHFGERLLDVGEGGLGVAVHVPQRSHL